MVNNKFQLTKQSSESEIKAYFIQVLNLARSKEEFPVNLDDVWPLVYATKGKAVQTLKSSELFMEGVDYQIFNQKVKNSDNLNQDGKKLNDGNRNNKNPYGAGRSTNIYMISVPCLEYLIARKVRPVFEVYRQVFHKVADGSISLGGQSFPSKPATMEETLAPLARYNAMIEDRFDLVLGQYTKDENVSELEAVADKCRNFYMTYRDMISQLVYVETACKLEGKDAFF